MNRDVEPYEIVGGVPAKHIRYRFSPDIIAELLRTEWWELPIDFLVGVDMCDIETALDQIAKYRDSLGQSRPDPETAPIEK